MLFVVKCLRVYLKDKEVADEEDFSQKFVPYFRICRA